MSIYKYLAMLWLIQSSVANMKMANTKQILLTGYFGIVKIFNNTYIEKSIPKILIKKFALLYSKVFKNPYSEQSVLGATGWSNTKSETIYNTTPTPLINDTAFSIEFVVINCFSIKITMKNSIPFTTTNNSKFDVNSVSSIQLHNKFSIPQNEKTKYQRSWVVVYFRHPNIMRITKAANFMILYSINYLMGCCMNDARETTNIIVESSTFRVI